MDKGAVEGEINSRKYSNNLGVETRDLQYVDATGVKILLGGKLNSNLDGKLGLQPCQLKSGQ